VSNSENITDRLLTSKHGGCRGVLCTTYPLASPTSAASKASSISSGIATTAAATAAGGGGGSGGGTTDASASSTLIPLSTCEDQHTVTECSDECACDPVSIIVTPTEIMNRMQSCC
jgi:hypothetical protein